jgi:hypothetical protein
MKSHHQKHLVSVCLCSSLTYGPSCTASSVPGLAGVVMTYFAPVPYSPLYLGGGGSSTSSPSALPATLRAFVTWFVHPKLPCSSSCTNGQTDGLTTNQPLWARLRCCQQQKERESRIYPSVWRCRPQLLCCRRRRYSNHILFGGNGRNSSVCCWRRRQLKSVGRSVKKREKEIRKKGRKAHLRI